ncbi:hypothetical protein AX774_g2701 [Zancudomyces culisetae]|uniref:Uncharacterized protein n=1 Tax=Zancudomyces culisetae TaxID=1213189 RepID=A0A1R1PS20_ZANCU|nr:hypothetical protein AX774_g2701 [Zancudomyces culisetae]|eukprot:OMH83775.1 hypothetical protein AX774_g2701 [Zancudomyces culisetae]
MAEQQRETQSKESGGNSSRDYDESSKAFNDELETDNLKLSFDKLSVNSEGLGSTRAYKGRTTGARSTSKANYRVGGGQEDWGGSMEDYEGDIPMTVPLVLSPQSPPTGTVFDNSSNTRDHGYLNNHGEIDEKEESEDELEAFLNKSDSPKEHRTLCMYTTKS